MTDTEFQSCPPQTDKLTSYDERHLVTYLRVLDADAEGADWKEAAKVIFNIDSDSDENNAKILFDNHLARAKWVSRCGYKQLLDKK